MKFKLWLHDLEESVQRSRNYGNTDATTALGPLSQYGQRGMKPLSIGFDNRAFAGLADGIGQARNKVRAELGAEPGVASQYHGLEKLHRDAITVIYLPLQTPMGYDPQESRPIQRTKGMVQQLRAKGDPLQSDQYWRVEPMDNTRIRKPDGRPLTDLYTFYGDVQENRGWLESAISFTEAMMFASIATRLRQYSHLVNTEKPRIQDSKMEVVPLGKDEESGRDVRCRVMMCSFVIVSRSKENEIDRDTRDDMARILGNEKPQKAPDKPQPVPPGSAPGTSKSIVTA
jgi:hypothetical protein